MQRIILFLILIFVGLVQLPSTAFSDRILTEKKTLKDSGLQILSSTIDNYIDKDGVASSDFISEKKILSPNFIPFYSNMMEVYFPEFSKLRVIEAKTITDGKEHVVKNEEIEDRALEKKNIPAESRMLTIPFKDVKVGSIVYLHMKSQGIKTKTPNHFKTFFYIGIGGYWENAVYNFSSELPLYCRVHDPFDVLDVEGCSKESNSALKSTKKIQIKLKAPFTNDTNCTNCNSFEEFQKFQALSLDLKKTTWASISTQPSEVYSLDLKD